MVIKQEKGERDTGASKGIGAGIANNLPWKSRGVVQLRVFETRCG